MRPQQTIVSPEGDYYHMNMAQLTSWAQHKPGIASPASTVSISHGH